MICSFLFGFFFMMLTRDYPGYKQQALEMLKLGEQGGAGIWQRLKEVFVPPPPSQEEEAHDSGWALSDEDLDDDTQLESDAETRRRLRLRVLSGSSQSRASGILASDTENEEEFFWRPSVLLARPEPPGDPAGALEAPRRSLPPRSRRLPPPASRQTAPPPPPPPVFNGVECFKLYPFVM